MNGLRKTQITNFPQYYSQHIEELKERKREKIRKMTDNNIYDLIIRSQIWLAFVFTMNSF